jgi:hypothetical protein
MDVDAQAQVSTRDASSTYISHVTVYERYSKLQITDVPNFKVLDQWIPLAPPTQIQQL